MKPVDARIAYGGYVAAVLLAIVAAVATSRAEAAPAATRAVADVLAAQTHYRTVEADGVQVFYREAGPANAPTVLLLHGFGASSFMFRDLIPVLARRYHVVAPDLPGFGETQVPDARGYTYSFASLERTLETFTDRIGLARYAIYVFDYGAPTGYRLALAHPERVAAIVSQNGNAYVDGLSDGWNPIRTYWQEPTPAHREALRAFLKPETTKWQYVEGVDDPTLISPDGYRLAQLAMDRPDNDEAQLDLFSDYQSNVALYPEFQAYFRRYQPPLLAVWGEHDPFFLPAGANAYRRDDRRAEVTFYPTGHLALESHGPAIAARIMAFLATVPGYR